MSTTARKGDLSHARDPAHEEGIGGEQRAWRGALDMAFSEAGIALLEKGNLLGTAFDRRAGMRHLQHQLLEVFDK